MSMLSRRFTIIAAIALTLPMLGTGGALAEATSDWQKDFALADCSLMTTGNNQYLVLEPGYQLVLEGGDTKLQITVLEDTNDVFYFGEGVDFYKNGKVTNHEGSWLAGQDGNQAGLAMPGTPQPKMKYYQEIAPGLAFDRAEVISLDETCETPAGTFTECLKIKEGTGLDVEESEYKYYAPNIGIIGDADLRPTRHGKMSQ